MPKSETAIQRIERVAKPFRVYLESGAGIAIATLFWTSITISVMVSGQAWKDIVATISAMVQAFFAFAIYRLGTKQHHHAQVAAEKANRAELLPVRTAAWDKARAAMRELFDYQDQEDFEELGKFGDIMREMGSYFSDDIYTLFFSTRSRHVRLLQRTGRYQR